VAASIEGWQHFLDGEKVETVNALIKKDNPSMSDDLIAFSRRKMREMELVDGGDAKEHGIGFMKVERVRDFYVKIAKAGMYGENEVDPAKAVTMEFVGMHE
jgi:NitT/TauT family transport system substrate-binding protein